MFNMKKNGAAFGGKPLEVWDVPYFSMQARQHRFQINSQGRSKNFKNKLLLVYATQLKICLCLSR